MLPVMGTVLHARPLAIGLSYVYRFLLAVHMCVSLIHRDTCSCMFLETSIHFCFVTFVARLFYSSLHEIIFNVTTIFWVVWLKHNYNRRHCVCRRAADGSADLGPILRTIVLLMNWCCLTRIQSHSALSYRVHKHPY